MKKYKTWEAFKILEENPESRLKFKTVTDNGTVLILRVGGFGYYHITNIDGAAKGASDNLHINNQEWELVKEPVDFIEAIKAYDEGKTIICKLDFGDIAYEPKRQTEYGRVLESWSEAIGTKEILEGKWYIQEDEE